VGTKLPEAAFSFLHCAVGEDKDISTMFLTINSYGAKAELVYFSHEILPPFPDFPFNLPLALSF
jgi:hypothetical protein